MMRGTVGRTSHGAVGMKVHGAGAENWVTRHNGSSHGAAEVKWIIAWRGRERAARRGKERFSGIGRGSARGEEQW